MACPHGKNSDPLRCSQCLGKIPRVVVVQDGHLYVDGKEKGALVALNKERQVEETEGNLPQSRRSCGRCRLPGHNAASCPQEHA